MHIEARTADLVCFDAGLFQNLTVLRIDVE